MLRYVDIKKYDDTKPTNNYKLHIIHIQPQNNNNKMNIILQLTYDKR